MTYTPNMQSLSGANAAFKIEQRDVERVLRSLIAGQSGHSNTQITQDEIFAAMPGACIKTSIDGWKRGQIEFAHRVARITAKHAALHKQKFCWKHRSVGLLRRLALLVMVATILSAQYL